MAVVFLFAWGFSGMHFANELRLFSKIQNTKLDERTQVFQYDSQSDQQLAGIDGLKLTLSETPPAAGTYTSVQLEKGDTLRAVAHKAVDEYASTLFNSNITYAQHKVLDQKVADGLKAGGIYFNAPTATLMINNTILEGAFQ